MFRLLKKKVFTLLLVSLFFSVKGRAEDVQRLGMIVGTDSDSPYVGWVSSNGMVEKVTNPSFPRFGRLNSVAMNVRGAALIGGIWRHEASSSKSAPYLTWMFQDGTVIPLSLPYIAHPNGEIDSVAINGVRRGIFGGWEGQEGTPNLFPYAGVVDGLGKVTLLNGNIPLGTGEIDSVAIDGVGHGIIGGRHQNRNMYVARVKPDGEASELRSSFRINETIGGIRSVAMNATGQGVIGGFLGDDFGASLYAAVVDPAGQATQIPPSAFPSKAGEIFSVAINSKGTSLIGGYSGTQSKPVLYAAVVDAGGTVTNVSPAFTQQGKIFSVSINNSGIGVIGGHLSANETTPYGAFVSQNGTLIPFKSFPPHQEQGSIRFVGIHDLGIALIGGYQNQSKPYAALVAPDGTVTPLNLKNFSEMGDILGLSVWSLEPVVERLVPKSFGVGNAWADSLFSLSTVILGRHLNALSFASKKGEALSLVANSAEEGQWPFLKKDSLAVWVSPFGMYARHKTSGPFPALNNRSVGALIGCDFGKWEKGMMGIGTAYAFQTTDVRASLDNTRGHQEWVTLYGNWRATRCTIEGALWGGLYQMEHRRHTLGMILSTASIKGTLCSPHVKISLPFEIKQIKLRPFAEWDWAHAWQDSIREKGESGLNLKIGSKYVSCLRSEFGFSFFESLAVGRGIWNFTQQVSYIHKNPFHGKPARAHYVGSDVTFDLPLFSQKIQNFASLLVGGTFHFNKEGGSLVGFNYQGEWGSKGLVQVIGLELKKEF